MPLKVRDNLYPIPSEGSEPGFTGREIVAIEDYFGLDGLMLISALSDQGEPRVKGYTKAKALFALAWVCMVRGGEVVSLDDLLNDYSPDDFDFEESDNSDPKADS
jgi:integrase